ncbi:uncharacterized protein V6R79_020653 [Siganus canaliculatus]
MVEAASETERPLNVVKRTIGDNNDLSGTGITWKLQEPFVRLFYTNTNNKYQKISENTVKYYLSISIVCILLNTNENMCRSHRWRLSCVYLTFVNDNILLLLLPDGGRENRSRVIEKQREKRAEGESLSKCDADVWCHPLSCCVSDRCRKTHVTNPPRALKLKNINSRKRESKQRMQMTTHVPTFRQSKKDKQPLRQYYVTALSIAAFALDQCMLELGSNTDSKLIVQLRTQRRTERAVEHH